MYLCLNGIFVSAIENGYCCKNPAAKEKYTSSHTPNLKQLRDDKQIAQVKRIAAKELPALTAHELRHTYGTRLRCQGVDIYTIQKILGHKDIKITSEIYIHNEFEVLRKELLTKAQ